MSHSSHAAFSSSLPLIPVTMHMSRVISVSHDAYPELLIQFADPHQLPSVTTALGNFQFCRDIRDEFFQYLDANPDHSLSQIESKALKLLERAKATFNALCPMPHNLFSLWAFQHGRREDASITGADVFHMLLSRCEPQFDRADNEELGGGRQEAQSTTQGQDMERFLDLSEVFGCRYTDVMLAFGLYRGHRVSSHEGLHIFRRLGSLVDLAARMPAGYMQHEHVLERILYLAATCRAVRNTCGGMSAAGVFPSPAEVDFAVQCCAELTNDDSDFVLVPRVVPNVGVAPSAHPPPPPYSGPVPPSPTTASPPQPSSPPSPSLPAGGSSDSVMAMSTRGLGTVLDMASATRKSCPVSASALLPSVEDPAMSSSSPSPSLATPRSPEPPEPHEPPEPVESLQPPGSTTSSDSSDISLSFTESPSPSSPPPASPAKRPAGNSDDDDDDMSDGGGPSSSKRRRQHQRQQQRGTGKTTVYPRPPPLEALFAGSSTAAGPSVTGPLSDGGRPLVDDARRSSTTTSLSASAPTDHFTAAARQRVPPAHAPLPPPPPSQEGHQRPPPPPPIHCSEANELIMQENILHEQFIDFATHYHNNVSQAGLRFLNYLVDQHYDLVHQREAMQQRQTQLQQQQPLSGAPHYSHHQESDPEPLDEGTSSGNIGNGPQGSHQHHSHSSHYYRHHPHHQQPFQPQHHHHHQPPPPPYEPSYQMIPHIFGPPIQNHMVPPPPPPPPPLHGITGIPLPSPLSLSGFPTTPGLQQQHQLQSQFQSQFQLQIQQQQQMQQQQLLLQQQQSQLHYMQHQHQVQLLRRIQQTVSQQAEAQRQVLGQQQQQQAMGWSENRTPDQTHIRNGEPSTVTSATPSGLVSGSGSGPGPDPGLNLGQSPVFISSPVLSSASNSASSSPPSSPVTISPTPAALSPQPRSLPVRLDSGDPGAGSSSSRSTSSNKIVRSSGADEGLGTSAFSFFATEPSDDAMEEAVDDDAEDNGNHDGNEGGDGDDEDKENEDMIIVD